MGGEELNDGDSGEEFVDKLLRERGHDESLAILGCRLFCVVVAGGEGKWM